MKKWLTTMLVVVLAFSFVLAGCGKGGNDGETADPAPAEESADQGTTDEATEPAPEENAEPVTLTLNGWGGTPEEIQLLQETIDEFQKQNPNIKVNYEVINDQYMDVIKTRLVGGEAGDVFYLDSMEAPALIKQDVLEPLDSYITEDFDIGDFEAPLVDAFKGEDGQSYGFPKDYSTLVLFYNKQHFEEAGITAPPQTWDELMDYSKRLTKDGRFGLGVAPELARQMFMVKAFDGKVVDENGKAGFASPEGLKGLQLVIDQHTKAKTSAQPSEVGAGWGGEMFGQGKASMVLEGNWAIPYLQNNFPDIKFGTSEVPTVNGKKGTMAFTVAYVMNKNSKHKEEAWKLLSFLTGKDGMKIWTSKGFALPTRKSVAAELGYDKDELRGPIVAGGSYATPWQLGVNGPTIMTNFNNQFTAAYLGDQALDAAMKAAQDTANKEIDAAQ